ncbi:MAG: FHA domain-containing protein [Bdellovibrionales bacterium]|nr:FHA domain-containing protein [Bdellovibrionales bacterium]
MWVIRILNGNQAGQKIPIKGKVILVGRAPQCDVKIVASGVSKEHAKIEFLPDRVVLTDLHSRNGTFINGIKVSRRRLKPGDKVSFHEVVVDIVDVPEQLLVPNNHPASHPQMMEQQHMGNLALQAQSMPMNDPHLQMAHHNPEVEDMPEDLLLQKNKFLQMIQNYLDEVVLPGVYKIPEMLEFKWTLGLFVGLFILFVTSLSSVPLLRILKSSIEQESQNRAMTIAKTLALANQSSINLEEETTLSVQTAINEQGVDEAFIFNGANRKVWAPASRVGKDPDIPFIYSAMKLEKKSVKQVDDDTIVAIHPIKKYDPNTGTQISRAFAVVVYKMGSLAVDDSRTLSLFIQTFFIALIVGGILFYFLYKVIEYPIKDLNQQLDSALKEGKDNLSSKYQFDRLQKLISNINSALSRVINSGDASGNEMNVEYDRSQEMENLIHVIGFPSIAIRASDLIISSVNSAFEERTSLNSMDLIHNPIDAILDQALRLSINDLVDRCTAQPDQVHMNNLEFSGINFEITIQSIYGQSAPAYFILTLLPIEDGGEY